MIPGVNIIWLYNPNDIAIVLNDQNNKDFPQRRSHLALEKYRKDRPHIYKSAGLIPTYDLRKKLDIYFKFKIL